MRQWLLKIIEVLDTIIEGLTPVTSEEPSEPEVTPSVGSTRSTKKTGGKSK